MQIVKLIKFSLHPSDTSNLCVYESGELVPFEIKRVFTIAAKENVIRGNHAHKKCAQLLVCVSGEIDVTIDNGIKKLVYKLNNMDKGLLIPAGVWASEKYVQEDSILMVLCDSYYDADDYIYDYEDFKSYCRDNF